MNKKISWPLTFEAMAILIGTIIGGGVFVLPYVNIKSGMLITNGWLAFLCVIMCLLHLVFGEIIAKTNKEMRLPGYAGHYLGKPVKKFFNFVSIFSNAFSLLIYIVLANKFLHILMGDNFNYIKPYTFLLVWLVLNMFLFIKLSIASKLNFTLTILLVGLMVILAGMCFGQVNLNNVQYNYQMITNFWYVSYGVIFFAVDGLVAMPMMFTFLKNKKASKKTYKWSVILSYMSVFIIFFIFMNSVSLLSGGGTSVDTFTGLIPFLGRNILITGALIGLLAVVTSYIVFINYYKDMLICDVNCNKWLSYVISMFLPLLFLLLDINKVDDLMSLTGGVIGGMVAVMVLLMYLKVRDKKQTTAPYNLNLPNWVVIMVGGICFLGAMSQIILRIFHLE